MNEEKNFPIVCIGGSAGSLKPFSRFLERIHPQTGAAVVIVNHTRRVATQLHRILPLYTTMPVLLIQDELKIELNYVYIIPSDRELHIEDHRFLLYPVSKPFGWPNVITVFLESLATNWNGKIIAGIVSGLNHDGVEALHQIKEAGGITFAQKPETADFKDMPEHAIESGWIDYILNPEEMGKKIEEIAKQA